MNCEDLHREIEAEFDRILKEAKPNGNVTDQMFLKSNFNELVQKAAKDCKRYYSIKWTDHGYALSYD
ncbi:hypothetical protein VDG40_18635 [Xanthomonas campestris pv. raphani]|uniref:hypothetical protein n=1 Tax=Xanthomonas campestris TaxID=339 RepID=UPI002B22233F|nr:hypothetical protein [Xanthomonas campestris]MEA9939053.1 hypothetical protein [Xanthomonas campestris pv. raphani]